MADTREQILDAARQLFMEHGYDKASLREVAERVGVTKAALYYYFPSKEALLEALLEPLQRISVDVIDMLEGTDPKRWADGLEVFIAWVIENRALFELIEHNEAAVAAFAADDTEFAETHQRFHDAVDGALANPDLPLERRVQLMCALGVTIAIAHFGRPLEHEDDHEIRVATVNAMRSVLGLRRKPAAAAAPGVVAVPAPA
jgi:AcrR family transcriptional regulator